MQSEIENYKKKERESEIKLKDTLVKKEQAETHVGLLREQINAMQETQEEKIAKANAETRALQEANIKLNNEVNQKKNEMNQPKPTTDSQVKPSQPIT